MIIVGKKIKAAGCIALAEPNTGAFGVEAPGRTGASPETDAKVMSWKSGANRLPSEGTAKDEHLPEDTQRL